MDPITMMALAQAGTSLLQGLTSGKARQREAQAAAAQAQRQRELDQFARAQAMQRNRAQALDARLGYLSGAQSQEQDLAGQRLAAMGLGKIQDFEQQQAMREGMSDVARDYDPTATAGSPMARALAGRAPNLARAITGDRYRESVGAGRTQESIRDYLARVEELRRDPNLDAESRAALDRLESELNQELPGVGNYSVPSGRGSALGDILGAAAVGGLTYLGARGQGRAAAQERDYLRDIIMGRSSTGGGGSAFTPRYNFTMGGTAPTSPLGGFGRAGNLFGQ